VLQGGLSLLRDSQPAVIFEVNDTLLQASGASRGEVERCLIDLGYSLHALDEGTARLLPLTSLSSVESENFVALPRAERD
jgi:hypothetical protein